MRLGRVVFLATTLHMSQPTCGMWISTFRDACAHANKMAVLYGSNSPRYRPQWSVRSFLFLGKICGEERRTWLSFLSVSSTNQIP